MRDTRRTAMDMGTMLDAARSGGRSCPGGLGVRTIILMPRDGKPSLPLRTSGASGYPGPGASE